MDNSANLVCGFLFSVKLKYFLFNESISVPEEQMSFCEVDLFMRNSFKAKHDVHTYSFILAPYCVFSQENRYRTDL